jgi:hypothetical protein
MTVAEDRPHYHSAEYHNGHLYVVHRRKDAPDWEDELWTYDRQGKGARIFTGRALHFRVSADGQFVAIVVSRYSDTGADSLTLLRSDGTVLKVIDSRALALEGWEPLGWADSTFWATDPVVGGGVTHIVKIRAPDWQAIIFDLSSLRIDIDFDLNPIKERVVSSDRPFWYDVESENEYLATKARVTLSVYDLNTQSATVIATSITKYFHPRWTSESTIEYDNPLGSGRLKRTVP